VDKTFLGICEQIGSQGVGVLGEYIYDSIHPGLNYGAHDDLSKY
jgi:hypothetical protein